MALSRPQLSSSFCPSSLLDHVKQKVHQLWKDSDDGSSSTSHSSRLVEQLLLRAENSSKVEKDKRKWLFQASEKIVKTLIRDHRLLKLFEEEEKNVEDILREYQDTRERNKRTFDEITQHHEALITKGYEQGVAHENSLVRYRNAANEMGKKAWVKECNAWMASYAFAFFFKQGARKAHVKVSKGENYRCICDSLSDTPLFDMKEVSVDNTKKPSWLDVGSCYNPFKNTEYAELFDVTGLDLCPADKSVYSCDFLSLRIGDEGTSPVLSDSSEQSLIQLPAASYFVITMSLVLSYLPSPDHRELMISQARKLLKSPDDPKLPHLTGLLLIAEKASIFDWKAGGKSDELTVNDDSPPSRYEWTRCICNLGFELLTYQTRLCCGHHVHVFAFRAADNNPKTPNKPTQSRMRIKSERFTKHNSDDNLDI